ncbi:MAG TPA: phosphotransferase [Candidatus Dormibacteraeota bacterium]|nr:phosphotransferase [Candidatus Dormibacteraeota bacterium]
MRVHWEDVPAQVRAAWETRLGARVVEAITQPSGFSPGLAARILLDDGRRVFIKAVSEDANPDTHDIHRREATILASLPNTVPAPRLHWSFDELGWVALCLQDIDGRHPHEPWTEHDLDLVIGSVEKMSRDLTPSPIETEQTVSDFFRLTVNGWEIALARGEERLDPWIRRNLERLAELEARAPQVVDGESLVHCDVRADNLLISEDDRVYVLDWPWARTGASWVDLVVMAPSVVMQGGPGCEEFLSRLDLRGVPPDAIDAVVSSLAGYFVVRALEPAPQGIPTVRAFQAAQGREAISWLRERTGWD